MEIISKVASEKEIPLIRQLAFETWNTHYPAIIGQAQVDYMLGKIYSEAALTDQMKSGHTFEIISFNEKPIGFLSFSESAPSKFSIHKFYVLSNMQGIGVGKIVFQQWIDKYKPLEIRLTVNRQNFKSINFYFRIGFIIHHVVDIDIENGYVMNDFEMIWKRVDTQ